MSYEKHAAFAKAIGEVNSKITRLDCVVVCNGVEFQNLQDDILRADLMPVLQTMGEIQICKRMSGCCEFLADSVSNANKYAESLTDLSHIGLEKSKKLQRGYLKVSVSALLSL